MKEFCARDFLVKPVDLLFLCNGDFHGIRLRLIISEILTYKGVIR